MDRLVKDFISGFIIGFIVVFIVLMSFYFSRSFNWQQCEDIGRVKGTVEYNECIDMLKKGKSIDGLV